MANKTWIAVALSCLIWFAYLKWFAPPMVPPQEVATTSTTTPGSTTGTTVAPGTSAPGTMAAVSAVGLWDASFPPVADASFKTTKSQGSFAVVGAKPASTVLHKYKGSIAKDAPPIQILDPDQHPLTFAALFSESAYNTVNATAANATSQPDGMTFVQKAPGLTVTKTFHWAENEPYRMTQRIQIAFDDATKKEHGFLYLPVGGKTLTYNAEDPLRAWEVASYQNESVTREALEKFTGETVTQGTTNWVAFGNRYFASAVIHKAGINPDVVFMKNASFAGGYLRYPLVRKEGEKEIVIETELYSGPKEFDELSKTPGMKRLIDYGTFSFLAFPMLELLRFFYKLIHNYGVAIILLTLLVRVLFFPLQMKSYASMKAMQKLQPQIAALKEKYKEEPQRFNQEQMNLFRVNKVNPMGGCLPMLVQLPVFIALYAVLGNSIELFHAPFFGWIRDLSAKDPYYVFPVLMGISMFVQQKMTPTPGMDPMQAKMMLLMPVIFSFIMLNLPSGLTVYIFLSTVLGILQQVWMNKEKGATTQLAKATTTSS